jgi:hypothetical protein
LRPLLQAARPSPAAPAIPPTKARRLSLAFKCATSAEGEVVV